MRRLPRLLAALALLVPGRAAGAEVLLFPSGLRVVLAPTPEAPRVATTMAIEAGSLDDPEGREGVAHLVEHLWFDSHLPDGPTAWAELEGHGCAVAADTWPEFTRFGASCPPAATPALLALELRRVLRPLVGVEDDALALAGRVVAAEEAERDDPRATTFLKLLQALYPADHPLTARLARPHLARALTGDDARAFAGVEYRPDQAVLAVTGGFDAASVRAWLVDTLGAPVAAPPPRVPARDAPPFRRALRVAPRVIDAPLAFPAVSMAWSLPPGRVGSFERALLADLVGRALWHRYRHDARVIDLGCADAPEAFATPLVCELILADDASAEDVAADLRATVDALWEGASASHLKEIFAAARSQTLVDVRAAEGRFGPSGGLADTLALSVLLGGTADALDAVAGSVRAARVGDLLAVAREHLAPERALVVAWRPTPVTPAPLAFGPDLAPPPRAPAPLPAPAPDTLAVDERTLPNGLRVLAIQRPGAPLVHAAARVEWPRHARDGVSELLDRHAQGAVPPSLLRDVLPWSARFGDGAVEGVLGDAADPVTVLARLRSRVERRAVHLDRDEPWLLRDRVSAERDRDDAAWWAHVLPRAALDPTGEARARAALVHLDAMGLEAEAGDRAALDRRLAAFRPDRTALVLVGPQPPAALLDAAARAFASWKVDATPDAPDPGDPVAPLDLPPLVLLDAPAAPTTTIVYRCPVAGDDVTRALLDTVADTRAFGALRLDTGWAYAPGAWVEEGAAPSLTVAVDVPHDRVPAALAAVEGTVAALGRGEIDPDALARAREGWLWANAPAVAEAGAVFTRAFAPDGLRSAADLRALPSRLRAITAADLGATLAPCAAGARTALAGPADTLRAALADRAPAVWTVAEARARVEVE